MFPVTPPHSHNTDDYFIPALNVLCTVTHLSPDFAGATLMPAGAEIPDVLISAIGMLVLHSDVGVGTISGAMLFNMLVIVGCCIIAVNTLVVNVAIVARDLLFFVASLFLLMFAAANGEITLGEALAFLVLYVVYVAICSQTNNIRRAWAHFRRRRDGHSNVPGEPARETEAPLLGNEVGLGEVGKKGASTDEASSEEREDLEEEEEEERELRGVRGRSEAVAQRLQSLAFREQQLSREMAHGAAYGAARLHGPLLKKCVFYDRLSVTARTWQPRWFVLDENFWYCRDALDPAASRRVVPLWTATAVALDAADPTIFTVTTPAQTYTFRACPASSSSEGDSNSESSNPPTASEWVEALNERLRFLHAVVGDHDGSTGEPGAVVEVVPPPLPAGATVDSPAEDDEDAALLARPPASAPAVTRAMWALTLPFAALFACTVPNVRRARWRRWFALTFVLVCAWLGALVYAMVYCADRLAVVLHIRADLMGLACTGIFASLPTLFGSLVCARQGAADMALANAIGSNTTCILLGFGVPFLVQTVCVTPGSPMLVNGESIPLTVVVLLAAVAVFLAATAVCCARLKRPAGVVLVATFVLLLATIISLNALGIFITF